MLVKNISYSVLFKVLGMALSLMMVPLLLEILGVSGYGVWAALTSLIVWITLFDFGMGHALKNTVSKSLAMDKPQSAQDEFFQVLKITFISSFVIAIFFLVALFFVDLLKENLIVSLILFLPLIVFFPLRIANFVLQGARRIALDAGLMFLNTLIFFSTVVALYFLGFSISLSFLALAFAGSYLFSIILISIKAVDVLKLKTHDLSNLFKVKFDFMRIKLSLKFFGLQLSSLVLYSLGTVIVYSYLSREHAAQFDVVNKIFIFGLSFFTIVISAFWPEITTYIAKNDIRSVRRLYFRMIGLSVLFSIAAFIVAYFSPYLIDVWTGSKIEVSSSQAIFFAILVSFQAIAYSGAVVLNAYEKINIQLALSLIATVLMVPLSLYLIKMGYEIEAIPVAAAVLTFFTMVYCNVHAYRLINKGLL